ncbi:MAG: transporter substrate-binding domain-containing protein [Kiritimatiellaeota bacterium]|nr:transporter substrate-binding domain-containing protein [Kiritimatiellota bacterium]
MRTIVAVFGVLWLSGFCCGCVGVKDDGSQKGQPPFETQSLRVGVAVGKPPLAYRNAFGELVGSEVELIRRFGERRDIQLTLIEYDSGDIFIALRRGDIDIAVSAATEDEIASRFLAICAPHGRTGQRLVANAEIAPFIIDLKQIDNDNVRVYSVAGSASARFAKRFFKSADVASLESVEECVEKVLRDNGCVFLTDETTAFELLKKRNEPRKTAAEDAKTAEQNKKPVNGGGSGRQSKPVLALVLGRLTDERIAWAVRRSDAKLKKMLDDFVVDLNEAEANPVFERVERPLFGVKAPSSKLKHTVFKSKPE